MTTITTLEVTINGKTHTLTDDDMILFQAKCERLRPFDFTFPGEAEPTRVTFDRLAMVTHRTIVDA